MGTAGLIRVVTNVADALANRRPRMAIRAFLAGLATDLDRAFATESDPVTGAPWPPRKGDRVAIYYKQAVGPLLVRTGDMKAAAVRAVAAPPPVWSGRGVTVTLTNPAYARFHQTGTRFMARRRFLAASPATREAAKKAAGKEAVDLIVGAARGNGLGGVV